MLAERLSIERFGEVFPHLEDILHCGFYYHSSEKQFTYWSPGLYTLLGVEPFSIDCSVETFGKFLVPEDREKVLMSAKRASGKAGSHQLDFSLLDSKGIYKRVHTESVVKTDEAGNLLEYSGVMKDITESYFYKLALEQKVTQLDKSNRNLQEFVYVASHDLQEPLRKITTFSERLRSRFEPSLGEEGNMYISRILNSCNNMQVLLEDLLSFSRLSSNDTEFQNVSLGDCLAGVLADLELKVEESHAVVEAGPLPEVQGYPSQLRQLFINLIGNAIKFRKPAVPPVIRIRSSEAASSAYPGLDNAKGNRFVKLEIEDNGIGFEQEFSEKIFMIFQRLNSKAEYAGSGIGLSICKKIVENHHGAIFASGEPDKGAVFTVLLPQKQT
jgi:signal transduction histidine kinase